MAEIAAQAKNLQVSHLELVEKIHDGEISDIKPPIQQKIASFVNAIRELRSLDKDVIPVIFFIFQISLLKRDDLLEHPALRVDSETPRIDRL
jgi:hypothetical protein